VVSYSSMTSTVLSICNIPMQTQLGARVTQPIHTQCGLIMHKRVSVHVVTDMFFYTRHMEANIDVGLLLEHVTM